MRIKLYRFHENYEKRKTFVLSHDFYCEACQKNLSVYGVLPEILFNEIFEEWITHDKAVLVDIGNNWKNQIVRFLEIKGYILTADFGGEFIQVRPLRNCCEHNEQGQCINL